MGDRHHEGAKILEFKPLHVEVAIVEAVTAEELAAAKEQLLSGVPDGRVRDLLLRAFESVVEGCTTTETLADAMFEIISEEDIAALGTMEVWNLQRWAKRHLSVEEDADTALAA